MVPFGCSMSILVVEPLCTAKGGFCRPRIHTAVDGRQKLEYSRGEPGNAKKGIVRGQMVDRQLASPLNAQESRAIWPNLQPKIVLGVPTLGNSVVSF